MLASADVALREDIFTQLTKLVAFVKQHIRRFLPEMLQVGGDGGDSVSRARIRSVTVRVQGFRGDG